MPQRWPDALTPRLLRVKLKLARRLAQLDANTTEDARITRTKKQLARLDDLIDKALDNADAELFLRLAAAKDRLWNLVTPKAGVLRPRSGKSRPDPLPSRFQTAQG